MELFGFCAQAESRCRIIDPFLLWEGSFSYRASSYEMQPFECIFDHFVRFSDGPVPWNRSCLAQGFLWPAIPLLGMRISKIMLFWPYRNFHFSPPEEKYDFKWGILKIVVCAPPFCSLSHISVSQHFIWQSPISKGSLEGQQFAVAQLLFPRRPVISQTQCPPDGMGLLQHWLTPCQHWFCECWDWF